MLGVPYPSSALLTCTRHRFEIPNDGKEKKGVAINYCPKIRMYFYMCTYPTEAFVKTFFPILFSLSAVW